MADVPGQPGVRPEIELAWRRAELAGLDPGMEVRSSVLSDIDRRSRRGDLAARPGGVHQLAEYINWQSITLNKDPDAV
jgi:hypothetical protein